MRSVLIGLLFVLQAATSFALDTLAVKRVPITVPWTAKIIAATEDPSGLVTTVIAENGTTYRHPHGTRTMEMLPAKISDRLEEAVAVDNRYIYASTGSTLIKYSWPGMIELDRRDLGARIKHVVLWTLGRVAVSTSEEVWSFVVEAPLNSGTILTTGTIASIASHDSLLYIATPYGQIRRANGSEIVTFTELGRTISHIAVSSTFLISNDRSDGDVLLYELATGRTMILASSITGRSIGFMNDTTIVYMAPYPSDANYFRLRFLLVNPITLEGYWGVDFDVYRDHWTAASRLIPISSSICAQTGRPQGNVKFYHRGTKEEFDLSPDIRFYEPTAKVSDTTIAFVAHVRRPGEEFIPVDTLTYASILEVDMRDGVAERGRRLPFKSTNATQLQAYDTAYYVSEPSGSFTATYTIGQTTGKTKHIGNGKSIVANDHVAWMIHHLTTYQIDSLTVTTDRGATWSKTRAPAQQIKVQATHTYQLGGDDRLTGLSPHWKSLQLLQAKGSSSWLSGSILPPFDDLTVGGMLPTGDNRVLALFSSTKDPDRPCQIWDLDFNNYTCTSTLMHIEGLDVVKLLQARTYGNKLMGFWESLDGRTVGTFVTDGVRWKFDVILDIIDNSVYPTMFVHNDTTIVLNDIVNHELIYVHPTLDPTVNVRESDEKADISDTLVVRATTADGNIRWEHHLHDATVTVFDIHGRQCGTNAASDSTCEVQLPGRGLFILQVVGGGRVKRMLATY